MVLVNDLESGAGHVGIREAEVAQAMCLRNLEPSASDLRAILPLDSNDKSLGLV